MKKVARHRLLISVQAAILDHPGKRREPGFLIQAMWGLKPLFTCLAQVHLADPFRLEHLARRDAPRADGVEDGVYDVSAASLDSALVFIHNFDRRGCSPDAKSRSAHTRSRRVFPGGTVQRTRPRLSSQHATGAVQSALPCR
jgi:hypothetical protein